MKDYEALEAKAKAAADFSKAARDLAGRARDLEPHEFGELLDPDAELAHQLHRRAALGGDRVAVVRWRA